MTATYPRTITCVTEHPTSGTHTRVLTIKQSPGADGLVYVTSPDLGCSRNYPNLADVDIAALFLAEHAETIISVQADLPPMPVRIVAEKPATETEITVTIPIALIDALVKADQDACWAIDWRTGHGDFASIRAAIGALRGRATLARASLNGEG